MCVVYTEMTCPPPLIKDESDSLIISSFRIAQSRSVMVCGSLLTSDFRELDLGRATMLGVSEGTALIVGSKFNLSVLEVSTRPLLV